MLRGLRAPTAHSPSRTARQIPCAALGAHHQTRWASSDKTPKGPKGPESPTFQGQMLESITQRIAREQRELRHAAAERQATGGARNAATTAREYPGRRVWRRCARSMAL